MKLKKLTSVLLALALLTQLLPLSVFAGDSEELLEYNITEEYTYTSADSTDNDALLEGYVEQLFGISDNDGIMLTATYSGEDALSGINLTVYQTLKSAVADIAAGNESSSIVTMTLNLSSSDYGVDSITDSETLSAAITAFSESFDYSLIVDYLLDDCPYELYWFNKSSTGGYGIGQSFSGGGTTLKVKLTFTFYVAVGYQDSTAEDPTTTVDSSKVTAAKAAVANAQTIVSTYANYSNWDKLTAYKDEICSLTSYDGTTTEETPYGDIWQLVYVFDGDEETKVVCEGYSKAFQYLCDLSGLYCLTVSGYMAGGTGSGSHMWNVVYLDGVNYLVDVTNSDAGSVGQDGGLFMVDDEDAVQILDGTETYSYCYGYVFYVNNQTITYTYGSTTLALYGSTDSLYNEYLALGEVSSGSGTTTVVPTYYGKTLTLDGKIGVTYYFDMTDVENPDEYDLVATVGSGTEQTYKAGETKTIGDVEYYRYTVYVGVADINSTIAAKLTDGKNSIDVSGYSVAGYCSEAISGNWDESELCTALLTYGYYAGVYNNKTTGITGYTDVSSNTVSISSTTYGNTATTGYAKTLVLDDEISIRLYMTANQTVYVDNVEYTPVTNSDSNSGTYGYYVDIPVPAKDMDRIYTIYDSSGNALTTYSVYTYIMNNVGDSNESLVNLLKAIYNYSLKAESYKGWI